jgi:hypothetical protein
MSDNPNDKTIDIIPEDQFLSWEDASKPETKRIFVEKFGKYVEYLSSIPLDKMAEIQTRYAGSTSGAALNRMMAILEHVMIRPALTTQEAKRAAIKGDSALIYQIVGDVVNAETAKEFADQLGKD